MTAFPYRLTPSDMPTMGLVVLQVDETIEQDFRRLLSPDGVKLHITRIPSGAELTSDTIADMEDALPASVALLPPAADFDVIGYACTSGATLIGPARVGALVKSKSRTKAVTDPLTAAIAALHALGIAQLGLISPYIPSVSEPMKTAFEAHGVNVPHTLSFCEKVEANVARIDPNSIREAAHALCARAPIDGLFLSCTNLRTLDIIADLEAELNIPVLSSNQVLAWHMARLAGASLAQASAGRLLLV
jgi:maleate isomerase